MKILMVSEDIPNPHLGGLGKHALNLAHALAARGHEVDLLGSAKHPIDRHPEQRGPGRFLAELAGYERGWKQQRLGFFHAWAHRANAAPLRAALLRHAPAYDIVHYHGHLPWVAASLPPGMPFVQTRHDQGGDCMLKTRFLDRDGGRVCQSVDPRDCAGCASPRPGLPRREISAHAVRDMRQLTARACERHATVFVSDFLKRNAERGLGRVLPGVIVHNAVDARQLDAVARQAVEAQPAAMGAPLRLFSAGALFAYKGFGPLLAAMEAAAAGNPRPYRLRLAGSGPLEAELRARFASAQTEFLGWTAYPQVVAELMAADAVLVPSVWDEPCATSILEALALGKTVFALRSGGTPEMAAYARSAGGELRVFDDLPALAVAALQAGTGAVMPAAPLSFENHMGRMAERIEEVYRQILAGRRPAELKVD